MTVAGQRVLITGASSGIGLLLAQELAQQGAQTVLLDRDAEGLAAAAEGLAGCAGTIAADVGDAEAVAAAVEQAVELLGGLDALVAGAGAATYGPFGELDPESLEATLRTTLLGTLNTAHASLSHLEASRGRLVVIGSVAGRVPAPWLSAYAAAKHGVRGFVRSLDCELRAQRRPVRLALIDPGPVDTPFWRHARTPDGRLPPEVRGAYRSEEVVAEVLRALEEAPSRVAWHLERTVGGLMLPAVLVDALAPNLVLPPLGLLARLGWRARERAAANADAGLRRPGS